MIFPLAKLKIFSEFWARVGGGRWFVSTKFKTNCNIPTFFFFETCIKLGDVYAKMWVIPNPDVAPYT